ncbi:Pycsar system effector family protein [Streptomyces sp. NPDC046887]|uniref:Pycsar system effector family protein n=1 Tax=Streptomyces sp. NPDC046887 TaxID=3155472 RepID=UPI003410FE25
MATSAAPPAPEPEGVRAGEQLLAELRAEIGRADTKASVLVGALGLCAATALGGWAALPVAGPGRWLVLAGGAAWALALGCLLFATAPRYRASRWRTGAPMTYFLDVRRAAGVGALAVGLRDAERDRLSAVVIALDDTSAIVAAKHRWIRVGLGCFVLGGAALATAFLAGS